MEIAHNISSGNCSSIPNSNCHHTIPKMWPGEVSMYYYEKRGIIDALSTIDVVGRVGLYVPDFTF